MLDPSSHRLHRARGLLQAARDEFARAEEAKGGAAVTGLRNACYKGWLAALEAGNAHFLGRGVPESELPEERRERNLLARQYMERDMRREFNFMWSTFYWDGYGEGIIEFDDVPGHLDELEEFIGSIAASRSE